MIRDVLASLWSSGFLEPILAAVGGIGVMILAYFKGRSDKDREHRAAKSDDYQDTRERMDEIRSDGDADAALERLRNRKR